jgi:cytochrome P450
MKPLLVHLLGLGIYWLPIQRNYRQLKNDPTRAQLVFDESLRLYPPAWVITRRTLSDLRVDDVLIPANSLVIVSPWLVHRNPKAWENPTAFMPDRFKAGTPQLGYIPFGAGARLCIGKEMARLEGSQILAHIATNLEYRSSTQFASAD